MKLVKVLLIIFTICSSSVIGLNKESNNLKKEAVSSASKSAKTEVKANTKNAIKTENKETTKSKANTVAKAKTEAKTDTKKVSKTETKAKANSKKQVVSNKPNTHSNRITADRKASKNTNGKKVPGEETVVDQNVEAEEVKSIALLPGPPGTDSPPKNIANQSNVPVKSDNPADYVSTEVTGQGVMGQKPPTKIELLPVTYVKELSPAGKASLELAESGDFEYQKLLNAGFETPKVIAPVIGETPTRVDRAATQEFNYKPIDPREGDAFWQNVEFNKYQNRLLDTHRYFTPAKFEKNMFGNIVVHAPSDSNMLITTQARNVIQSDNTGALNPPPSFVSLNEEEALVDDLNALDTSEIIGLN